MIPRKGRIKRIQDMQHATLGYPAI